MSTIEQVTYKAGTLTIDEGDCVVVVKAGSGTVVIAGGEDSAAPIFLTASEVFELADWLRSLQVKTVDAS